MKQTNYERLRTEDAIDLIGKQWMLVTAGNAQGFNTIATKERCSSTYRHILAIAVEIWPGNLAAPSYGHTVCALLATAAIVPADEQVVPAVLMEYERCLYGVLASVFGSGVAAMREVVAPSACYCPWTADSVHGAVKRYNLYAVPKASKCHPWPSVGISTDVGINGIPVVAVLPAGNDTSLISPLRCGKGGGAYQSYGRGVPAECRATIGYPPSVVETEDVGCAHVVAEARNTIMSPCRYAIEMETMLGDMGYRDIKTIKDIYGKNRNTICRK